MSVLDRVFRREKALTGTQEVVQALATRQLRAYPALGGTNVNTRRIEAVFATAQTASYAWMYANSPAVRTVVDLIARNAAQLDLRLYEEVTEAEREARPDHPAALSLRYPSPQQTRTQFVRAIFQDYLVNLNAYALKIRGAGRIVLKPVPAHMVDILGQGLWDAEAYRITDQKTGDSYIVSPEDVIHWRGWNPLDPRIGLSPLETLRSVIAEDAALQATLIELSKSGLAGPTVWLRPLEAPEWSNDARDRFEEDMANRMRLADKRPPVAEEGMTPHQLGISPRDSEMLASRQWAIQQVASQYGLHPASVGLDGDIEQAQKVLYTDVLPPYCEEFTRQLDLSVLQEEYGETEFCFEFNLDEKHMGDDRITSLVSASGRPVMTTDEARAKLNLPPIDGGDELVTPMNVTVGDNPKPSVDIMGPQDPNKPPQDGSYRAEEPKALQAKQFEITTVPRTQGDLARQQRYVDEVAGMLQNFYGRQYRRVKGAKAFDRGKWDRELGDDLHTQLRSIVEREGGLYVARLLGDDFDMRQVENYLKAMAQGVAEGLNGVTAQDISDLGVDDAFARARGERADVAAASIGTRATVFARIEAGKQSPQADRRVKTWIPNTDRHASLAGATVPLEASFGSIEPGSEPGCKCSVSVT